MLNVDFPPFAIYLLRSSLLLALIYIGYQLWLQRTPHLAGNRLWLLGGLGLSLLLPLVPLSVPLPVSAGLFDAPPEQAVSQTTLAFPAMRTETPDPVINPDALPASTPTYWWSILLGGYLLGVIWAAGRWLNNLWQLRQMVQESSKEDREGYTLLRHRQLTVPCSFFQYVMVGEEFDQWSTDTQQTVLMHERAHIGLRHSWDLLLMELVAVLLWFHPLVRVYRSALQAVHEYQADEVVARKMRRTEYARLIVQMAAKGERSQLVHSFAQALVHHRVARLLRPQTGHVRRYLWLVPSLLLASLIVVGNFSCQPTTIEEAPPASSADMIPSTPTPIDSSRLIPSIRPIQAAVNSGFGDVRSPRISTIRHHTGVDMQAPEGTPIYAAANGLVVKVDDKTTGYGKRIVIEHLEGHYQTTYSHMAENRVAVGQRVSQGQVIGLCGSTGRSTGPHLHYEVRYRADTSEEFSLVNPANYFPVQADDRHHQPFLRPVDAPIHAGFGKRMHPVLAEERLHRGADFVVPTGTPVVATADGKVIEAGRRGRGRYGKLIVIQHGKGQYKTLYAHLSEVKVSVGQRVSPGDVIGLSGNTGLSSDPHLHYEVLRKGGNGKFAAVDPSSFFVLRQVEADKEGKEVGDHRSFD